MLQGIFESRKEETAKLRSNMEAIQQDIELFQMEMNALRSVINTTDVDPACRGACNKALEANACGIVEPK